MPSPLTFRRFPGPWTLHEEPECLIVRDATGVALAHFPFSDVPDPGLGAQALTRHEARVIAQLLAAAANTTTLLDRTGPAGSSEPE